MLASDRARLRCSGSRLLYSSMACGEMAQREIVAAFAAVHAAVARLDVAARDVVVGLRAGRLRLRRAVSARLWCGLSGTAASFPPRAWRRPWAPCRPRSLAIAFRRVRERAVVFARSCGGSARTRNAPERAIAGRGSRAWSDSTRLKFASARVDVFFATQTMPSAIRTWA